MVGYVQAMLGKNKLLVKYKDGKKRDMSSSLRQFLFLKEQVDMDDPK